MKRFILFLVCILLCGCAPVQDLNASLDEAFSFEMSRDKIRRNNYSKYIDYYLPSDTSEFEGSDLSGCFVYDRSRFIMDVNVSGIINDKYYPELDQVDEGFFDKDKLVYTRSSSYIDVDGNVHDFLYRVYDYDDRYLTYFLSNDLIFYGYALEEDLVGLSSRILLMAKGAEVRKSDVVANYSLRDEIDFEKQQVNLFETIMPVNGNVNEFLINRQEEESTQ